ncbi:MAG: ATP-binding protein [Bacteroidia bacterium]
MTIRLRLFIGFAFLIVIFLINFLVNQSLSREVKKNIVYLGESETVLRNSDLLNKSMTDMQSGFRGFLLTGQEVFLSTYNDGIEKVPPLLKQQRALVTAPKQKVRLDSINVLHTRWVNYANDLISTKRDTLPESGIKYKELFETRLKKEVGKKLNDEIRRIFIAFDGHEYSLRKLRREALESSLVSTGNINLALTLFSLSLAIITCFYIVRIITNRISRMVTLAQEISKGNFKAISDNKQDELQKLSESLNLMSKTLDKNFRDLTFKNKELDQFAYIVSHDLKAPLRGIINITKWMEEDHHKDMTPEIQKHIDLIKGRALRLESMINGLLEYARIGRTNMALETVNVKNMLSDLVEVLVPKKFDVEIGEMPVFTTERLRLEQVFSNLITNAVKYSDKEKGNIQILCIELESYYQFEVRDNGAGIQSEYYDKIFMIFQTLRERDAFESTGVGLAIVKKIIDDQKATIKVESEFGKGTTFTFTWPKKNNKIN